MGKQLRVRLQKGRKTYVVLVLSFTLFHFFNNSSLYSQTFTEDAQKTRISFDERLAFYLNQQSKAFLHDLAVKEKLLLQLIENVTDELRRRGKSAILYDELGYEKIHGDADRLIADYERELSLLVDVLSKIKQLERVVDQSQDLHHWEMLANLRQKVLKALEDRQLHKRSPRTKERLRSLFSEYHTEVDSVLALYKRLSRLERRAGQRGDRQMQSVILAQMDSINVLLGNAGPENADSLAGNYMDEVKLLANLLNELQDLQTRAIHLDTGLTMEVEQLRRSILKSLDNRLLSLMGYTTRLPDEGPSVSDLFQEWKANQYANYKIRFTKYRIMKKSLLESSTPVERSRMLERDLRDAFLSYVDKNYELAEQQFDLAFKDYGEYFESLEAVLFYRAESFFARNRFDEAVRDYERVVTEFPDSEYLGDSLFRLMLIHQKFGNYSDFYNYYDYLTSLSHNVAQSLHNKCNYLAGYVYLKDAKFEDAERALSKISEDSKYSLMAKYIFGIALVNQGENSRAIEVFQDLAHRENYPWNNSNTAFISNSALLKLGYLHYELGEYAKAGDYFDSVSPGFEKYDRSLLGSAWANLKQGNYKKTVDNVDLLFRDYLASDYTYEALVLAAHAKKILNKHDSALRDLRYVANARRVLELSDEYNVEREELLEQLATLERLEEQILDRRDDHLYSITSQIRGQIQNMLVKFRQPGSTGDLMIERYEKERQTIARQISELDRIISRSFGNGHEDIAADATRQRQRLIKTLEVYQADEDLKNVNYFQEYPLATKEGSTKYRRRILSELAQNASVEQKSLEKSLQEVRRLKKRINEQGEVNLSAKTDLALLENDLEQLKGDFSGFRAWLAENEVDEMKTDFDQWADFSGFGMSDITFGNIRQNEDKIAQLAQNRDFITRVLQRRKKRLEKRLQDFERQVELIEEELKEEQVEVEKENKEEYFKESYFDTTESEVKREKKEEYFQKSYFDTTPSEVEKEEDSQTKSDDSNPKKQNNKNNNE